MSSLSSYFPPPFLSFFLDRTTGCHSWVYESRTLVQVFWACSTYRSRDRIFCSLYQAHVYQSYCVPGEISARTGSTKGFSINRLLVYDSRSFYREANLAAYLVFFPNSIAVEMWWIAFDDLNLKRHKTEMSEEVGQHKV